MKVLQVNTFDQGGAAKACIRFHMALLENGIDSKLLTLYKSSNRIPEHYSFSGGGQKNSYSRDIGERFKNLYSSLQRRILRPEGFDRSTFLEHTLKQTDYYSFVRSSHGLEKDKWHEWAEVINLHWVADFIDFPSFFKVVKQKPVVWTLHDMSAFTGGCHYSSGCDGFKYECRSCPPILQTKAAHLSFDSLKLKKAALTEAKNLTIVALSRWLHDSSKSSELFKGFDHHLIPNSVPIRIFQPLDKMACKKILGLPHDKKVILFVSQDLSTKRKGFDILLNALRCVSMRKNLALCSIGEWKGYDLDDSIMHVPLGTIHDEKLMAIAYNAADLFINPAREDNLPNTVVEAIACGTPVIGFPVGGMLDIVKVNFNGILAKRLDAEALSVAINNCLIDLDHFDQTEISKDAHSRFGPSKQVDGYKALYQSLLQQGY